MAKAVYWKFWKVPEPKSYEQVSLVKLTLPWLRFKWGPTINVWGGGGVCGRENQEVRWLGQRGTYQSLNIERQQFSQPTKELTNTRPRGLWIWYTAFFSSTVQDSAPVPHLNKILQLPSAKKNNTTHKYLLLQYSGKIHHQISPGKAAVEKTGRRVQKRAQ